MRIAVVGSGIGGLAAAEGLQRTKAEVKLFERATDLRAGGSGLSIFGNGLRAMDALGLGKGFREITSAEAAESRAGQRRPDGVWLSTYPTDALSRLRVVDRAELHSLLLSGLDQSTVAAGHRVREARADGWVTFVAPDGSESTAQFDLVVAADGLNSTIRRSWKDDPGVKYAGYSAWRGITEHPIDLRGDAGETWGVGRRFGIAPLADGRVYWFGVVSMPPSQRYADDAAALGQLFGDWHQPIPQLLDVTSPDRIQRLPIEELAGRLKSFTLGRVALLGDAAHAMTPNLGQGGGQALEDAATLATLLEPIACRHHASAEAVSTALRQYDTLRRPRSQKIARRARMVGRLAHVQGRTASNVRNILLRATPERMLRRQFEWLQSWEPPR